MKLIGNYLSPYVRRVAVSLNLLDVPYDLEHLFVFKEPNKVQQRNPVVRIPVLILDDGTSLIESYAILDEIDRIVGPDKALTPASGTIRRAVMQATALALACAEKAQWAFYEGRVRPPEKVHQPWIEHNEAQVKGGFAHLNKVVASAQSDRWIAGTDTISQADITTAVAFSFALAVRPNLRLAALYPELNAHVGRCEALDAFKSAPLPEQID